MRAIALCLALLTGCRERPAASSGATVSDSAPPPAFEPPVVTNAESPVHYPPVQFQQNVEGTVLLRLFVDSLGRLAPESTRVAEASGVASLDSAALAGVRDMKFVPAQRNGRPVAASFLQPIHFRRPERK